MYLVSRFWRIFRTAAACFVLALILLYTSPVVPALAWWLIGTRWEEPKGDILIVLGGDQLGDGTLGIGSYWRSVYAVRAFRPGGFQRIVVTGGRGGPSSTSIARAMADFMVGLGVPREDITLEEQSTSTRENALFTARMIRGWTGKKVLMSSDVHMRRAYATFKRAGLDTIPSPIPDVGKRWNSWPARWDCIWEVGVSLLKYGYYAMRGWL
jgi:uncharacterized SAM-binding protein YcdF (DUF218 family)